MSDFPKAAPDFSQPIAALKACHERIRAQCDTLRRLLEHVNGKGCDEEARAAAANVMRYFDTAARHHHADEEEDLLPHMMAAATLGRGSKLTRMIADIANEHRAMSREWTDLRAVLQEISAGDVTALDPLLVDRFVKLYHSHITVEEASVYPLAEMLLSADDLREIGASMAERRGLPSR